MNYQRSAPIYQQIVIKIEEMVKTGELRQGSRIPSTIEFARQYKVAKQTAQNALKELTSRGVLKRIPRKGTFVSENLFADTIAMFFSVNPFADQNIAFSRLFYAAALNHAEKKGWSLKLYFPHLAGKEHLFKAVGELEKDISDGKIRAVLCMGANGVADWFEKSCPVPCRVFTDIEISNTTEDLICRGLGYLARLNHKKIALLYSSSAERQKKAIKERLVRVEKALDFALETDLWEVNGDTPNTGREFMLEKIAEKKPLPDALLILDDVLAGGVIFALQEKNIPIPAQIAILTLSVKGIDLLAPVPLTKLEYNPEVMAQRTLDLLFDKLDGRQSAPSERYCPELVVGKSCGEK